MKPQISVIIPVYNVEKYIAQTLDSLLWQTFKNFESICVDDGSTDKSVEILEAYRQKDKRIKIIHQPNSGVVVARNNGVAQATSELIYPLDGDDILHPDCLKKLYEVITTTTYRVVASEAYYFSKGGGRVSKVF